MSYLNRTVILVDLNSKLATGGEVLWLREVALKTMVLHGVHVVLHADQPALVAGPDFLKVGNDVISTKSKEFKRIIL